MPRPTREETFLALLEEHKKILYKVSNAYCRNPADREDLVQEMAAQLWRSFERFDERFRFSTWMYRVALNVAISFQRNETRRSRLAVEGGDSLLEIAAESKEAGISEDVQLLHRFIEELDALDRALMLLYLDGNRHDAIAEVLGISETNVGTKIGRIKQRFRRDFARVH